MSRRDQSNSLSAVELLEEVFHLVKVIPFSTWAVYYAATFPFVLAFLYFWADMANHAFAHERLTIGAAGLTLLFIAMKTGQTIFAGGVMGIVTENDDLPSPRIVRIAMNQTIVQPTGILILPLCLFVVAPFGWAYAAYQNVTVLDDGRKSLRDLVGEAREQAGLNQKQNNVMLWLLCPYLVVLAVVFFLLILPVMSLVTPAWADVFLSLYAVIFGIILVPLCPFGAIVALNLGLLFVLLPSLLKIILGIDTPFTISPMGAINPTFFVIVAGMTYLCLDPLIKIAYCLRCFYGASIHTGQDLRLKLRRIARASLSILLMAIAGNALYSSEANAQDRVTETASRVEALDGAIDQTLQDRKFAWRYPRQRPEVEIGFIETLARYTRRPFEWLGDKLGALREWFVDFFDGRGRNARSPGQVGQRTLQTMFVALLGVLLALLLYVLWRTWRRSTIVTMEATKAQSAIPDLEDEGTTADELPSNEWMRLAAELLEKGEIRLAMRAYFFAGLARMAHLRLIRVAAHKSNREYAKELQRIAHVKGELVETFKNNLRVFESVWYGEHILSEDALQHYVLAQERIGHHA